jgi:hypothetical protein
MAEERCVSGPGNLNGGPTADPPFRGLLVREKPGTKGGELSASLANKQNRLREFHGTVFSRTDRVKPSGVQFSYRKEDMTAEKICNVVVKQATMSRLTTREIKFSLPKGRREKAQDGMCASSRRDEMSA